MKKFFLLIWGRITFELLCYSEVVFTLPISAKNTEFGGDSGGDGGKNDTFGGEKLRNGADDKILAMINNKPDITVQEIADKLGIAKRTVEREIQYLRTHGIITRIGGARGGRWKIV